MKSSTDFLGKQDELVKRDPRVVGKPHVIEKILKNPLTKFFLKELTKQNINHQCLLAKIFQAYINGRLSLNQHIKYFFPLIFIELMRLLAEADKEILTKEILGYPPRVRALINTARSIGAYGLTRPQIFYAPLMVVWNFTQARNLRCRHCYQDAGRALPGELTLAEQLEIAEQLIDLDVAILAFSGGEPLLSPNLWPVARKSHEGGMYG